MSKKYINANALIDKVERMWDTHQLTNTKHKTFVDLLNAEPPADVRENVHGEWKHDKDDSLISGYCSNCGWESIIMETDVADMDYCPSCGADMRGEER